LLELLTNVLADRAAARSMIGYWHHTVVCLSVCLSVALCIAALRVDVEGIESCTAVFLARRFLFTSSDTFAARCVV